MPELAYVTATVYGHVKGVYYRAFTSQLAKSLNLRGYVRNMPEVGAVQIHVEGPKEKLEELLRHLEVGPPEAVVDHIDTEWSAFSGQFSNFEVRY
ncbi:MAG TPA: acylphosphatase [Dehalococcoidia bacterium]|jgi:acylphosphatase